MIRILPIKSVKGFPRTYKRGGIHTFEQCKRFINHTFKKNPDYVGNERFYNLSLSDTEENRAGGIIISTIKGVKMEIKKEKIIKGKSFGGLSGLCYGDKPDQGLIIDLTRIGHTEDKTKWLFDKPKLSKVMLRALDYLKLSGSDNFNSHYMRGYFEFLQTKSDRIVFWDYKDQAFFRR